MSAITKELKDLLKDDYCISLDKKRKGKNREKISISSYENEDIPNANWVVYIEDENLKVDRKLFGKIYDAMNYFIEYCGEKSVEKAVNKIKKED